MPPQALVCTGALVDAVELPLRSDANVILCPRHNRSRSQASLALNWDPSGNRNPELGRGAMYGVDVDRGSGRGMSYAMGTDEEGCIYPSSSFHLLFVAVSLAGGEGGLLLDGRDWGPSILNARCRGPR